MELERIYGIQQGKRTDIETFPQNAEKSTSQEELASQFGLSVDTLSRYKQLADMIPEIQSLVETHVVTPTTATTSTPCYTLADPGGLSSLYKSGR